MKEYYQKIYESNIKSLMNRGLTKGEAKYVINRLTNKVRKHKGWNAYNEKISIDDDIEVDNKVDKFVLKSGKVVTIGINFD